MIAPADVTIRKAQPADGPTIISLICALAEFENLPLPDADAQKRLITDAFADRPRFEVFLAELPNHQTAGYAFVFETYSTILARPTLYLEDLFVLPEFRAKRIGLALFRYCVAEALRRGCGRMDWAVLDWNAHAIGFYDRQGGRHLREWLPYRLTADQMVALLNNSPP